MQWSNMFTAGAIFFEEMNMQSLSKRTFTKLQTSYIVPAVEGVWDKQQASIIEERTGKQIIIITWSDSRCDSPGFSAKYEAYTLMELEAKKVLDIQLVQVTLHP